MLCLFFQIYHFNNFGVFDCMRFINYYCPHTNLENSWKFLPSKFVDNSKVDSRRKTYRKLVKFRHLM